MLGIVNSTANVLVEVTQCHWKSCTGADLYHMIHDIYLPRHVSCNFQLLTEIFDKTSMNGYMWELAVSVNIPIKYPPSFYYYY